MERDLVGCGAVLARWRAVAEQRSGDVFKVERPGKGPYTCFFGVQHRVVAEELCGGELQVSQIPREGYGHLQRWGHFLEVKQVKQQFFLPSVT